MIGSEDLDSCRSSSRKHMAIKFNCPHCAKSFTVRDHLAGKRANCSACKKPIVVPKQSSTASVAPAPSAEDIAAAAFKDAPPAPAPVVETKTLDFNCPQCDEPVQVSIDLQGKQTACPHCRRIVKVPLLIKQEPVDWRTKDARMPTAARRDTEPAPEGAWGSAAPSAVSKQALQEIAPLRRRRLTLRQKLVRGGILAACVLFAGLGTWIAVSFLGQREQKQAYAKAIDQLKAEDSKLAVESRAALFAAAGVYRLRSESSEGTKEARDHFQQARKLLSDAKTSVEREQLLAELALVQIELGGDDEQAVKGLRLKWDDTAGEIRQTLQQIREPDARAYALRKVSRALLEKNQRNKIVPLAQQLSAPRSALPADPKAPAQGPPEDAPELYATAGLECLRAGLNNDARALALKGREFYNEEGAQPVPPVSASLTALCLALEMEPPKPGRGVDDQPNLMIGSAHSIALKGDAERARQLALTEIELAETRLKALVAIAGTPKDKRLVEAANDALALAEARFQDQRGLSPWLLLQLIEYASAAEVSESRLYALIKLIPDADLSGRAGLIVLRDKLGRTSGKADMSWADGVNKNSVSYGLAHLELARHNARRKALSLQDVDKWDDNLRAFGYLGVALGMQEEK
jgi:hypothetical protein